MTEPRGSSPLDFSGKTALVTGGSRGIGAVLSEQLARQGAHVIVGYRSAREAAEATVGRIEASGGSATARGFNLVHPEDVRDVFDRIPDGLDILVHNAAIGVFKPALEIRPNQWDLSLSVNARALLLCAQAARPRMRGRDGAIVAVSSLGSARFVPEYGAIGASKAALESLVRTLAVEMAPDGVRVNAVSAGVIDGPTIRRHPRSEELLRRSREAAPGGRLGTAEELASAVLFLCSPLSAGIVGQTLIVDRGVSLVL